MRFSDWTDFTRFTQEPKFHGSQRKQNLICIYEDHNWAFWTHNKILTYFINRLIIEEDAANECLAIRSLVSKGTYGVTPFGWGDENHERIEFGHEKTKIDEAILSEIFQKAAKHENIGYETHFLLGTAFYNSPDILSEIRTCMGVQSTENWQTIYEWVYSCQV